MATRYDQVVNAAAVEAIESLDDGDQRLLGGVERAGVVSGESATDRIDAGLMLLQKGIKSAGRRAGGGDQPEIVGIGCDAATLARDYSGTVSA